MCCIITNYDKGNLVFITSEDHSHMTCIGDENVYVGGDVFSDLNVYVCTVGIHIDCILNEH